MAVTRRFSAPTLDGAGVTLHFRRRLIVTIDDLEELIAVMTPLTRDVQSPTIAIPHGSIDDPSDMRELADGELDLTISTDIVTVRLSPRRAQVVGPRHAAHAVVRDWEQFRRSAPRREDESGTNSAAKLVGLLVVALLVYFVIVQPTAAAGAIGGFSRVLRNAADAVTVAAALAPTPILTGVVIAVALFGVLGLAVILFRRRGPSCILIPLGREEYRLSQYANRYTRNSWIVAIYAAVIATVAIMAQLLPQIIVVK